MRYCPNPNLCNYAEREEEERKKEKEEDGARVRKSQCKQNEGGRRRNAVQCRHIRSVRGLEEEDGKKEEEEAESFFRKEEESFFRHQGVAFFMKFKDPIFKLVIAHSYKLQFKCLI